MISPVQSYRHLMKGMSMHNQYNKPDQNKHNVNTTPCLDHLLGAGNQSVVVLELLSPVLRWTSTISWKIQIEESSSTPIP